MLFYALQLVGKSIVYSIQRFLLFLILLIFIHSTRLDSLLFFLEIIFDVGFHLLELLLGVAEFPGECEADLAQRHLYRHILYIV